MRAEKKTTKKTTVIIIFALVVLAAAGFTIGMMAKSALASGSGEITMEQAKSIALSNVGVSAEKATFTQARLDDDGHYEIDFYTDSNRYDFEIDGQTGSILEKECTSIGTDSSAPTVEQETSASTSTSASVSEQQSGSDVIGVEAAKKIALKHAGVSNASFQEAKLDSDDGIRIYEIEFVAGGVSYEYEINAYTGNVIDWERSGGYDYDDD